MRYFSTFSGIGGFELGIQQAYEATHPKSKSGGSTDDPGESSQYGGCPLCIGYSEIDKYAITIYGKHFDHRNFGSIRDIVAEELPDFGLLCGGFPCQSFSIAGKRGGFEDTRGTLFFDIARIAKVKRPRLLLLENVKGLLSHDGGRTFNTIIGTLDELGYDLQWQVLNSKNFGVPQNRERIFIIGHLRGTPRPKVFPFREDDDKPDGNEGELRADETKGRGGSEHPYSADGENGKERQLHQLNRPKYSSERVYGKEGISPSLTTMQGGNLQPKVAIPVLTPDRPVKRQNGRRFKEDGEESFTLTSQDKHGVFDGMKIRRLTPVECCRLQGFPDDWVDGVSDSQKYKMLGNAVTVNVIQKIAEKLL
jgi:DNA (cytosine-5)-methyltransferase 1